MTRTDTFDRANSTTTLGTPSDGGSPWVAALGTWGISSNRAYCPGGVNNSKAYLEVGSTTHTIQATLTGLGAVLYPAVMGGYIDANTYYVAEVQALTGEIDLMRVVGGTQYMLSASPGAFASGSTLGLSVTPGASSVALVVTVNGVTRTTYTDTDTARLTTGTKAGLRHGTVGSGSPFWDALTITTPTVVAGGRVRERWNGTALVLQRRERWNGTALVQQKIDL